MKINASSAQSAMNSIQMELTGGPPADPSAKMRSGGLDERGKIKELANEFESFFLNMVLKSMRDTIQKTKLIDGGNAEDIYSSMLDDEYSKQMASQRNTGLADNIERFLLQSMDVQDKAKASQAKTEGFSAYAKAAGNSVQGTPGQGPLAAPQAPGKVPEALSAWTSGLIRATIGNGTAPLDPATSAALPSSAP